MSLTRPGHGLDSGFSRSDLIRRTESVSRHLVATFALLILVSWTAPAFAAETIAVVAAHLIDGKIDQVRHDLAVLIEGDRIATIGDVEIIPADARVIDLGSATILPGLIDTHVHPLIREDDKAIEQQLVAQEAALAALMAEDLTKLNQLASERDVPYVVTP